MLAAEYLQGAEQEHPGDHVTNAIVSTVNMVPELLEELRKLKLKLGTLEAKVGGTNTDGKKNQPGGLTVAQPASQAPQQERVALSAKECIWFYDSRNESSVFNEVDLTVPTYKDLYGIGSSDDPMDGE